MKDQIPHSRRLFLKQAALSVVSNELIFKNDFNSNMPSPSLRERAASATRQIRAGVLDIGYFESGPSEGPAVLLLHGFPYSIESYAEVSEMLAAKGCRVIVPHLRGHGSTSFLHNSTVRSGQQAAIGMDVIALMNALRLEKAVLAGYDWGGRAACVVAALWPQRCTGLVSVNSYLIQDIAKAALPLPPAIESGLWYQYYFQTERGRAGLTANRHELARTLWMHNSPGWRFDESTLARHTTTFNNPDYVDVVIHSYRHRMGLAEGYSPYEDIEHRLAALPVIAVPSITLDGKTDGVVPANDGRSTAAKFSAWRSHRIIANAGHNLPEEAPAAFVEAVLELVQKEH